MLTNLVVSKNCTTFAADLRNQVINRLKDRRFKVMIIRLILVRIFSFMGTEKENINNKVEATIGAIYVVLFIFVVYVVICVAYD